MASILLHFVNYKYFFNIGPSAAIVFFGHTSRCVMMAFFNASWHGQFGFSGICRRTGRNFQVDLPQPRMLRDSEHGRYRPKRPWHFNPVIATGACYDLFYC